MMQQYQSNSYLFGGNAPYVEELYEAYLQNPSSVPDNWRAYFDAMQNVPAVDGSNARDIPHAPIVASFAERAKQGPIKTIVASADSDMGRKRVAATQLIAAYRNIGSHWADLDPLKRQERPPCLTSIPRSTASPRLTSTSFSMPAIRISARNR